MLSEKSREVLISLWGISTEFGQGDLAGAIKEALELIDSQAEEIKALKGEGAR